MLTWHAVVADFRQHAVVYLSMPFVAALVGYVTKVLAIRMMFQPIRFIGIPPWFGWQGIVPRKAATMTAIAVDTLTQKLLSPRDVFARLDPAQVAAVLEQPLMELVESITAEVGRERAPRLWEAMPEPAKRLLFQHVQGQAGGVIAGIMQEMESKLDRIFDLKAMAVAALTRDKALLNRIFLEAGQAEFTFIRRCGIPFGFAIGLVQVVTWALTHSIWVMPLFGAFTGWFTDWLALKMVFSPRQPRRYLGLVTWQGLFLKHRKQVAAAYGELIARELLTGKNLLDALLRGPGSDKLYELIQRQVEKFIDEQTGSAKPMVVLAVGSAPYREMKAAIADRLLFRLPDTLAHVEKYAEDAMDIRNTLVTKMQELSEEEFEGVLRPVFRQEEWILIFVGALLGFLVGELQVFLLLH